MLHGLDSDTLSPPISHVMRWVYESKTFDLQETVDSLIALCDSDGPHFVPTRVPFARTLGWHSTSTKTFDEFPGVLGRDEFVAVFRGSAEFAQCVNVEAYARWAMLFATTRDERVFVARAWCCAFFRVTSDWRLLRSIKRRFNELVWFRDDSNCCPHSATDIFGSFVVMRTGWEIGEDLWTKFVSVAVTTIGEFYKNGGWQPPKACFYHWRCPSLLGDKFENAVHDTCVKHTQSSYPGEEEADGSGESFEKIDSIDSPELVDSEGEICGRDWCDEDDTSSCGDDTCPYYDGHICSNTGELHQMQGGCLAPGREL